jgi:hypothetical protein
MRYDFLNGLRKFVSEQVMTDEKKVEALQDYIIASIQRTFDNYYNQQGDQALIREEVGGVEKIFIKPFGPLKTDRNIEQIRQEFSDFTREDIIKVIEDLNDITQSPSPERDQSGNLKGFWVDLVNVAGELYDGEHMKVDVFTDDADDSISFGIDDPEEVFQVSLD